jgi:hypothetical protein
VIVFDQPALYGENGRAPYYAARGSDRRSGITLRLPVELIERLAQAEQELGVAVSDLVAVYVQREVDEALSRKARFLNDLDDHSRIHAWMPSGTPIEGDA